MRSHLAVIAITALIFSNSAAPHRGHGKGAGSGRCPVTAVPTAPLTTGTDVSTMSFELPSSAGGVFAGISRAKSEDSSSSDSMIPVIPATPATPLRIPIRRTVAPTTRRPTLNLRITRKIPPALTISLRQDLVPSLVLGSHHPARQTRITSPALSVARAIIPLVAVRPAAAPTLLRPPYPAAAG